MTKKLQNIAYFGCHLGGTLYDIMLRAKEAIPTTRLFNIDLTMNGLSCVRRVTGVGVV